MGLVWSLGLGTNANAIYVLETSDGASIMVTEKAHVPHVQVLFETGSEKYAWLNNVTAYAAATHLNPGVSLDVWQVRIILSYALYSCRGLTLRKVGS